MSWLFSQALVEEFSEATSWDGEPSAPLSVMPTQHKFWRNDKMMEPSKLSQFGLTCAVLTEHHGEALLMWFLADSLARTYQPLEAEQEFAGPDQGYGVKWRESSVRYDLNSSSWKTHLCLWEEDLPWSSVTLPRWGMTRSGALFQHPTLERPISEKGYGLWPTPLASDGKRNGAPGDMARKSPSLGVAVKMWPTPNASDSNKWSNQTLAERKERGQQIRLNTAVSPQGGQGGQLNPEWVEWLMGWPIGWTELKPLAMDKFREWQQQHSRY